MKNKSEGKLTVTLTILDTHFEQISISIYLFISEYILLTVFKFKILKPSLDSIYCSSNLSSVSFAVVCTRKKLNEIH